MSDVLLWGHRFDYGQVNWPCVDCGIALVTLILEKEKEYLARRHRLERAME